MKNPLEVYEQSVAGALSTGAREEVERAMALALNCGLKEGDVVRLLRFVALEEAGGNVSEASRRLGVNRRTLHRQPRPRVEVHRRPAGKRVSPGEPRGAGRPAVSSPLGGITS